MNILNLQIDPRWYETLAKVERSIYMHERAILMNLLSFFCFFWIIARNVDEAMTVLSIFVCLAWVPICVIEWITLVRMWESQNEILEIMAFGYFMMRIDRR